MKNIPEINRDISTRTPFPPTDSNHLVRQRINKLLTDAMSNRVITVYAGAGCGKTRAVSDFLRQQKPSSLWLRLSESDNSPAEFWQNITDSVMRTSEPLAERLKECGFPDTKEKLERISMLWQSAFKTKTYIFVFDDFHLITEPLVLGFMEKIINGLSPYIKIVLIYRDLPKINIKTLRIKGFISEITEEDLNFTESELTAYFKQQGLNIDNQTIREIHKDIQGWAFTVNLVARSLKKMPKYAGFVKTTLKPNVFELMESENWATLPARLKKFMTQLSLIDHLSLELVALLADGDEELLDELKQQSAYIRMDIYGGAYIIHHLYLEFLKSKQEQLLTGDKHKTYKTAADWCNKNNFKMDALGYYEKVGDYESIVAVFFELPLIIPYDIAQYAKGIFDRAPAETFDNVHYFASTHINIIMRLGFIDEFFALAKSYEQKFLALPEDDTLRKTSLSGIYLCLGMARAAYAYDGNYDFDVYFAKLFDCMTQKTYIAAPLIDFPRAAWINMAYSHEAGEPQKYIETMIRSDETTARYSEGVTIGSDLLIQGELLFYQGNIRSAVSFVNRAAENSTKRTAYDTLHRALFYLMRISVAEGNLKTFEAALLEMEELLDEKSYFQRFITYDISRAWSHYILRQPKMFPEWLSDKFYTYLHASTIENFSNQVIARHHYLTRNYQPLLSYISEMKQRESFVYGRLEMLAIEACVHYQMKNKSEAMATLKEAYKTASPNNLIMPFIELGKDMRTLTMAALREPDVDVPRQWLESIKNRATSYAKNQSLFINEYKLSDAALNKTLSAREQDVLSDLYHGFSQAEIARKHSLSVNTVKMVTKNIYEKLHVHKISDLIRVAAEQRLV